MVERAFGARFSIGAGKKAIAFIMMAVLGATLALGAVAMQPQEAFATSSANKAATKAYRNKLKSLCIKSNGNIEFYYTDINKDRIRDLVVWAGYQAAGSQVYTYKYGKLRKLVKVDHGYFRSYYSKKKVLTAKRGHKGIMSDIYYKWNNKKIKRVLARRVVDTNPLAYGENKVVTYYVKGKKVSASKYKKYVRGLKAGKRLNLAAQKMKDYKPASTAGKAKSYLKRWAKYNGLPSVDRIDCEGYYSGQGYRLRGVWSYATHDATAYRCYVSETGRVSDYEGVGGGSLRAV